MQPERGYVVAKHNDMIQKSRFQLSAQEQKVIQFLISKIKPKDKALHTYRFSISEFCGICGIDSQSGNNYKNLKDTIQSLADKSMWVMLENGKETLVRWINKAAIDRQDGVIEIRLDDDLIPYLLQLQNNYTQYALQYILSMDSRYSIRFYEVLRSLEYKQRQHIFNIEDLKRLLNAEKYKRYSNFKQRVLDMAVREINELSDITVSYVPIREGRKIVEVEFSIQKKDVNERLQTWENIENKKNELRKE